VSRWRRRRRPSSRKGLECGATGRRLARRPGASLRTYGNPADTGSSFRTNGCDYVYDLAARNLGPGSYRVGIVIDGQQVGSAGFTLI